MAVDAAEADEGIQPKVPRSPSEPAAEEIEAHEAAGHAIHRTWCGHCMRARGLVERHAQAQRQEKGVPILGMDYFYFSQTEEGLPHLQVKDDHSGMCWASPVPSKGNDAFAVNFVLNVLDEVGYRRLILRSDNEPSIKALKSAVKAASQMDVILEESKTGDSQSNGLAEAAVRESKGQCRAALQEKLNMEVDDKRSILTWIARHGNFLVSRYRVGHMKGSRAGNGEGRWFSSARRFGLDH